MSVLLSIFAQQDMGRIWEDTPDDLKGKRIFRDWLYLLLLLFAHYSLRFSVYGICRFIRSKGYSFNDTVIYHKGAAADTLIYQLNPES